MYITLRDGTLIFVRVIGNGPPTLLLHGYGLESRQWLPFVGPLLKTNSFIIPDARSHGLSGPGRKTNSDPIQTMVQDISEIVDHLHLGKFKLIGYSLGAIVGLSYLVEIGSTRVERYLHIEAGPKFHSDEHWNHGFNSLVIEQGRLLLQHGPSSFDPYAPIDQLPPAFKTAYRSFIAELTRMAFPPSSLYNIVGLPPAYLPHTFLPDWQFSCAFFDWMLNNDFNLIPELSKISSPVTLVCGRLSQYFPSSSMVYMQSQIENSELHVFEKSGHSLPFTDPIKFFKVIRNFLKADEALHPKSKAM